MDYSELLLKAHEALDKAYAPYSHFKVGAAILTSSGAIYTGCNVENSSYGATICAERTACVKAVSEGETSFTAIAIVSSSNEFTHPCGVCRQVLSEFFTEDGVIVLEDNDNGIMKVPFSVMMPFSFTKDCIK